jgi:hypothetical protein
MEEKEKLLSCPRWWPDTTQTGRLAVGRKITLTEALQFVGVSYESKLWSRVLLDSGPRVTANCTKLQAHLFVIEGAS